MAWEVGTGGAPPPDRSHGGAAAGVGGGPRAFTATISNRSNSGSSSGSSSVTGLARRVIACLDVRNNDQGDLIVTKVGAWRSNDQGGLAWAWS